METNFIELRDNNSFTNNAHALVLTDNFVDSIDKCKTGYYYYDKTRDRIIIKMDTEIKEDICLFEAGDDLIPKPLGIYKLPDSNYKNSLFEYVKQ